MNVSKSEIVDLFDALGFASVKTWNDVKLNKKVKRLPTIIEGIDDDKLNLTEDQTELLAAILDDIIDQEEIIIELDEEVKTVTDSESVAETVTESPEVVETVTKPEPYAKPISSVEKTEKQNRPKLPALITAIIREQEGEFKAKDILAEIGENLGFAKTSINTNVSTALVYAAEFGIINKVSRGVYNKNT